MTTATLLRSSRRSDAQPTWATPRRPDRATFGGRVSKVAELLGVPPMPWQRLVWDVAGEVHPDTGLPAYRTVIVTVMRQSGKSVLVFASDVERCTAWDEPQRVVYSAQTGDDARKKIRDDHAPMLLRSPLRKLLLPGSDGFRKAAGDTSLVFANTSRIDCMSATVSAGHGRTVAKGDVDEAFDDEDDRREQALLPAMMTKADAQLWITSTAGTAKSVYLRRQVEVGRAAAAADSGEDVAYFEWAVPREANVDDEEVWWEHMPSLGWTIQPAAVRHARQTMKDSEFRRAVCNQWTEQEHDHPIPLELWAAVQDREASPVSPVFALDVLPDQSAAAVAGAGAGQAAVLDHLPGTSWVLPLMVDLLGSSGEVAVDAAGPARSVAEDLELAGVSVRWLTGPDVAAACARLYRAVADKAVRVRPHPSLDAAIDGLAKKPVGDRFVWSRTTSTADVTPLMALSLALHASQGQGDQILW